MFDKRKKRERAAWVAAGTLLFFSGPASGGDIAAVLTSATGPYAEAYAGFARELGISFDLYDLSKPGVTGPEDAKYAAAFGAKASALDYPPGTHMVYALTPVAAPHTSHWHEISMVPAPGPALAAYKKLQPDLRRLAVFWKAYPGDKYISELRKAGEAAGIEIVSSRLKSPDAFPERLRSLMGKIDAFWLMPDPALITHASVMVLASFSCANAIPFYAPTSALVAGGATASYAPEFAEAGAAAARAILVMYRGGRLRQVTYVNNIHLHVNRELIEKCRWPVK